MDTHQQLPRLVVRSHPMLHLNMPRPFLFVGCICRRSASYAGLSEWEEAAHDAAECIKVNKNFVKGAAAGTKNKAMLVLSKHARRN